MAGDKIGVNVTRLIPTLRGSLSKNNLMCTQTNTIRDGLPPSEDGPVPRRDVRASQEARSRGGGPASKLSTAAPAAFKSGARAAIREPQLFHPVIFPPLRV